MLRHPRCAILLPSSPAGASGNTLNEALCINTSLHFLEMVIVALQELTHLLTAYQVTHLQADRRTS
jgi:hypothetical protein|tara:strand:+ start:175 stop:372 length:198 start_codon:yes stop_codon:yes gene_type:complete